MLKNIPPLQATVSLDAYRTVVRAGAAGKHAGMFMPYFEPREYPEETLVSDWELLQGTTVEERASLATEQMGPDFHFPVGTQEVDQLLQNGLEVWRKQGKQGACQDCHQIGADLVTLSFSHADIMRRCAGQELTVDECWSIVRFIDARRSTREVGGFCDPRKEFLPAGGGRLLHDEEDATAQERDLAFIEELRSKGFTIGDGWMTSVEESNAFKDRVIEVGLRNIAIPLRVNSYAAERNFAKNTNPSTMADWVPMYASTPADESYYQLFDEYIENPSPESMWKIYDSIDDMTEQAFYERPEEGHDWVYLRERYELAPDCATNPECEYKLEEGFEPGLYSMPIDEEGRVEVGMVSCWDNANQGSKCEQRKARAGGLATMAKKKYSANVLVQHLLHTNKYPDKDFFGPGREANVVWNIGQDCVAGGTPHGVNATTGIMPDLVDMLPLQDASILNQDCNSHLSWMDTSLYIFGAAHVEPAIESEYWLRRFLLDEFGMMGKMRDLCAYQVWRLLVLNQLNAYQDLAITDAEHSQDFSVDRRGIGLGLMRPLFEVDGLTAADGTAGVAASFAGTSCENPVQGEWAYRAAVNIRVHMMYQYLDHLRKTNACATEGLDTWFRPGALRHLENEFVAATPSEVHEAMHELFEELRQHAQTCEGREYPLDETLAFVDAVCRGDKESSVVVPEDCE